MPQIVASLGTKYKCDLSQKAWSVLPVGQNGFSLGQCLSANLCPFKVCKGGGGQLNCELWVIKKKKEKKRVREAVLDQTAVY